MFFEILCKTEQKRRGENRRESVRFRAKKQRAAASRDRDDRPDFRPFVPFGNGDPSGLLEQSTAKKEMLTSRNAKEETVPQADFTILNRSNIAFVNVKPYNRNIRGVGGHAADRFGGGKH